MKRIALLACLCAGFLNAATTATWELNGYQDFLRGRMQGLSLSRDGKLTLGPKLDTLHTSDQAEIWSMARAADGTVYLGTGNRGRLYRMTPGGVATLVWTAEQPEIFAVTVDPKGIVYAGTSPDGKVYRIENGKATEYFAPGARYIWALAVAPDGALMVATGDQGKIFRVTAANQPATIYYETGQSHVTALAFDKEGRLLAGSEPNGILYRINGPQKAFVLYDANLPEIRAIVPAPDGSIYVAALGGSVAKRANSATSSSTSGTSSTALPTVSTSVTVSEQQAGLNPAPDVPKPAASSSSSSIVTSTTSTIEYSGVDKSALYKIQPDNTVETLWSSKDENVYDVVVAGTTLTFLTDFEGRIYRLNTDRQARLIAQTREGDATRLLETPEGLLASTGNLAKILRLSEAPGTTGSFESPVHDANTIARWGRLGFRGSGALAFRTRTGNTARPDTTWSDWSQPISNPERAMITSPNARYIQWRAELTSGSNAPSLDNVTLAYLPQNTPPVVRGITVSSQASGTKAATTTAAANSAYSITVTDSGETASAAGTTAQTISRATGQQLQISWQADDPDGDRLLYTLHFRGEDETQWKLLRANMSENTYLLDGDVFADGRYYFRVSASDRPSNAQESARDAELISAPVMIDNTPPVLTVSAPLRIDGRIEIIVDAEDKASSLRRCEYSVDANPWMPVEASDGVTDSPRERFTLRLEGFPPGEHLVVIRAFDATGNAGLTKVVVR